jgi:hypothetical protein
MEIHSYGHFQSVVCLLLTWHHARIAEDDSIPVVQVLTILVKEAEMTEIIP